MDWSWSNRWCPYTQDTQHVLATNHSLLGQEKNTKILRLLLVKISLLFLKCNFSIFQFSIGSLSHVIFLPIMFHR